MLMCTAGVGLVISIEQGLRCEADFALPVLISYCFTGMGHHAYGERGCVGFAVGISMQMRWCIRIDA